MPGTEVATYTGSVVDEYRPRIVMAPEEARELDEALRTNMKAVLHEDVDYGVIPGTGTKPTLLKPGAEKLLQWFGFGHSTEVTETERDADGGWQGVTYRCTVTKSMPDGRTVVVAMCEGYAGYDEDRFYLTAEAATAKERAMAEQYKRAVRPAKCVEYRAPRNSVMKMAQKRALVGAALQATSASTLFTQDVEDNVPAASSAGPDVTATARQVVMGLPVPVRNALDHWYRSQSWPQPGQWDAGQWCAALVQAGRLTAELDAAAGPQHTGPPLPDGDPWALKVEEISSPDEADAAAEEVAAALNDGSLDDGKATLLFEAISARKSAVSRASAA